MKTRLTIAITGANGFLGSALTDHFVNAGWDVIALVRQPKKQTKKKGVMYRHYDISSPLNIEVLNGANYLVHAAYVKQDRGHPNAFRQNIAAATDLVSASKTLKLHKLIFVSSMSAHKQAVSAYGKQKLEIEKLFNDSHCVCIRPGLIVGNGGIVRSMAEFMLRWHVVPLVGGGKQPLQIVSADELCVAIENTLLSNITGTLTVATTRVYSYKEFYSALARYLNVRVFFVPIPLSLLLGLVHAIELMHLPLRINADNVLGLKKLAAVDNRNDLKKLGITIGGLEESLQKSIAATK